jgi:type IX secretion system PorP/SprF family membrane protein
MKKSIVSLLFATCASSVVHAQMGARIDQYYLDRSILIPAAIAHTDEGYFSTYYNKLFLDVPGAPQHTTINGVMPGSNKNTAFGIFYMKENIAFSEMHNAYATYAYAFKLGSESKLSLGVSAGVLSQNFDATKAVYYDENDARINALMFSPPVVRADLRASIYFSSPLFYTGFSITRLPQPRFDYSYYNYTASYELQSQANFLLGFNAKIDEDFTLQPSLNFGMYNWDYMYFQANANFDYKNKIWLGLGVNNLWQAGFNLGFKPQEAITVAYSFKLPDGQQKGLLGPIHEFTAIIGFSALGGGDGSGSGKSSSEDSDMSNENDYDGQGKSESQKPYKEVVVKQIEDLEKFGMGNDTSGIKLPEIPKLKPAPGHYLVTGLHTSEDKANQQIKEMYLKNVIAFKFYDPRVKSYYVFVRRYNNEKDANKGEFYYEGQVPRVWIREITE